MSPAASKVAEGIKSGDCSVMTSDVVILFGGASSERLVSVGSAQNMSEHLTDAACWFLSTSGQITEVSPLFLAAHQRPFQNEFVPPSPPAFSSLDEALISPLTQEKTFVLALHGGAGENGEVQKCFERRSVAFTGSASRASADAFDKVKARQLASAKGAKVAPAHLFSPSAVAETKTFLVSLLQEHPHWVLKPQADGSSHGLIHLERKEQLDEAAQTLVSLRLPYLAEVFVAGRELTVGVVDDASGPTPLPVSEVQLMPGTAFDYAGKYLGRGTQEITPAQLTSSEQAAAQALAVLTHSALGCFGYSRTDMILTSEGPVLLEINTLPGLTKASFIPQQLKAAHRTVEDFLHRQIELARIRRHT